jgi:hypothetical protein
MLRTGHCQPHGLVDAVIRINRHGCNVLCGLLLQTCAFAVALPTTIAVVMLLVWHIRMVASNKTTIEHAEVNTGVEHARVLWFRVPPPSALQREVMTSAKATIEHAE